MSKKKNISYLFGLAFLLLAGCDTDTATVPLPDDGERAVEVRLRASVCTVETTVGRSVIEGTALNTGDEIGIFLMRDSNFSTPYLQNLPYRYAEGGQLSLQPEGTKCTTLPGRTRSICTVITLIRQQPLQMKTVKYPFPLPPLWKQRTPQTTFTPVKPKAARKRLQPQQALPSP